MPLVDNHQVKQNFKRPQDVVEVVVTVAIPIKVLPFQFDVSTKREILAIRTFFTRGRVATFRLD